MTTIFAHYVFHPVGQGLFASGALYSKPNLGKPSFRWVYDCGTSSPQYLVKREIDRLYEAAKYNNARPVLDLVTISHFDKDHISGIVYLLEKFHVRNLLLPYLPLWQRIVLAYGQSAQTSADAMSLYLTPVNFIEGLDGAEIDRIILASPSSGESQNNEPQNPNNNPETPWEIVFESSDLTNQTQQEFGGYDHAHGRIPVHLLREGCTLKAANLQWEFLPYNDSETFPKPSDEFLQKVASKRDELLNAASKEVRQKAQDQVEMYYDAEFGTHGYERNGISLHLYGGPIRNNRTIYSSHSCQHPQGCRYRHFIHSHHRHCGRYVVEHMDKEPSGILYTGDAFLETPDKLKNLLDYLKLPNNRHLLCLQVMHHGSEKNWHAGCAKKFKARISVFSSNPNDGRYRHPDIPVWTDFGNYGRKQVNEDCGLSVFTSYT